MDASSGFSETHMQANDLRLGIGINSGEIRANHSKATKSLHHSSIMNLQINLYTPKYFDKVK